MPIHNGHALQGIARGPAPKSGRSKTRSPYNASFTMGPIARPRIAEDVSSTPTAAVIGFLCLPGVVAAGLLFWILM